MSLIIKDVVTIRIGGKPHLTGCIYNDSSGTFKDGEDVVLPEVNKCWTDTAGNTFVESTSGKIYQIEFWREK